jgi:hypothetical protein
MHVVCVCVYVYIYIYIYIYTYIFLHSATGHSGPGPRLDQGFTIILRHTTLGRTPLDELSARSGAIYLVTSNTQKRQISMAPAGSEPAIPTGKLPQTHALDGATTGIGCMLYRVFSYFVLYCPTAVSNGSWTGLEFIPLWYYYWNLTLLNRYFDRKIGIVFPFPKYPRFKPWPNSYSLLINVTDQSY